MPQPQLSESQLKQIVIEWLEANRDRIRGKDGRNGTDSASINVSDIGDYLAANHADQLRGPVGPTGPAGSPASPGERGLPGEPGRDGADGKDGERGLVGVPSQADIQNWLIGATGNPETRQALAVMLADLVSADPRVDALIERLEAVEQQERRVLLVEDGNVIDDESYPPGEPIVLDLKRIVRSNK